MKKYLKFITIISTAILAFSSSAEVFNLESPDGKLKLTIDINKETTLTATIDGKTLIKNVKMRTLSTRYNMCTYLPYSLDRRFHRGENPSCDFNQLEFSYTDHGYKMYIRAYNDAVAYCVELKRHPVVETIIEEHLTIPCTFDADFSEGLAFFEVENNKVAFVETKSPFNYPEMKLAFDKKQKMLKSDIKKIKNEDQFDSDYIFKVDGKPMFLPWRAFVFSSKDDKKPALSLKNKLQNSPCGKKN